MAAPARLRSSLRARILTAAFFCVALALVAGGAAFNFAATRSLRRAIRANLDGRAGQLLSSGQRYLEERTLTLAMWAEAEAMHTTLESSDPKFAEDYLRRTVQDQAGAFSVVALLDAQGTVRAAVGGAPAAERRGYALQELLGVQLAEPLVGQAVAQRRTVVGAASGSLISYEGRLGATRILLATPVRDFAGDCVGVLTAVLGTGGIQGLLASGHSELSGEGALPLLVHVSSGQAFGPAGATVPSWLSAPLVLGLSPSAEVLSSPGGDSYLYAKAAPATADGRSLVAAVVVEERVALGEVLQLRRILLGAFLAILGIVSAASALSLRRALQPLGDMTTSLVQVAKGDLSTRLEVRERGELGELVGSFNTMVAELARARLELASAEALRREVEIARTIQTGLLPRVESLPGFELAALTRPASEVGGDFYDVVPVGDSFWILIGDVSGHGLNAGLVMLMVQAAGHALIRAHPGLAPRELVAHVNRLLYENLRVRMGQDDYVTMMAARYEGGGRFLVAGAHQPVFVTRGGQRVDQLNPKGPWCGLAPEIAASMDETMLEVGEGEAVLFITDGMVEAQDASREMFGDERLAERLSTSIDAGADAQSSLGALFRAVDAFMATQADDMTAIVLKRRKTAHA